MEVSVLEAKRLDHRAVLRLSWCCWTPRWPLSTLLQVAVAPPALIGYLSAGATPVWLLGCFACSACCPHLEEHKVSCSKCCRARLSFP
jgi:hypothetical protein